MVYYSCKNIKGCKGGKYMIRPSMCFDGFCDFYCRRKHIRATYAYLSRDEKMNYKYYVYSRRILRERLCDMIWGYLTTEDDEELSNYLSLLDAEYMRCQQ